MDNNEIIKEYTKISYLRRKEHIMPTYPMLNEIAKMDVLHESFTVVNK